MEQGLAHQEGARFSHLQVAFTCSGHSQFDCFVLEHFAFEHFARFSLQKRAAEDFSQLFGERLSANHPSLALSQHLLCFCHHLGLSGPTFTLTFQLMDSARFECCTLASQFELAFVLPRML